MFVQFTAIDGITIYPDTHKYGRSGELPAVEVVVYQGHEDLTIKVSDNGGGVKRSDWHKLWHYGYTTSSEFPPKESYGYHSFREHFSGGGYGLPMARLFARYFGGEVTFTSLEGYGSSVFIQAHRLGRKTEMVPGHASFSLQPLYS
jgi:pyruvate dehydrogenase kinase 2/3/4